jgi:hypothetical protein
MLCLLDESSDVRPGPNVNDCRKRRLPNRATAFIDETEILDVSGPHVSASRQTRVSSPFGDVWRTTVVLRKRDDGARRHDSLQAVCLAAGRV